MDNVTLEKCPFRFAQTEALGISFISFHNKQPVHSPVFTLLCAMYILSKHSNTELHAQPWMYTLTTVYLQIFKYLGFFQIGTVPERTGLFHKMSYHNHSFFSIKPG